jgi:hypothetical protein
MPGVKGRSGGPRLKVRKDDRRGRPARLQATGQTVIVGLRPPGLPCAIRANTPSGTCGKPSTRAYAWPQEPAGMWATPGLWTLQPVCAECAKAAAKVYDEPATSRG